MCLQCVSVSFNINIRMLLQVVLGKREAEKRKEKKRDQQIPRCQGGNLSVLFVLALEKLAVLPHPHLNISQRAAALPFKILKIILFWL